MLRVSKDTVDRAIKELKEKAGLKIDRKGLRKNNRYYLLDRSSAELLFSGSAMLQIPTVGKTRINAYVLLFGF